MLTHNAMRMFIFVIPYYQKILSPFLNIYSGVHQYHFHSSVFASCIICIDIEDCPDVSLCDPTRLSHNITEAYYTLAVKI